MTAQPAPSRIDTYDFAFRTTPDSHLYWQSTLCSIFTDRLIPCLEFKILVKRSTIPMPFLATSSRSWLSRNDNRFEILDSVPIRSRHQKASPPKPTAISKKLYPREGVLEDEWKKFRKKYEDEELARSYWPSCRTRGIPGLDSATFPHLVPPVNSLFTGVITKLTGIS